MISASTIIFGLIGGIVPALIWLWFWLREDPHPEPMRLIIHAFLAGMLMVPVVLPFQQLVDKHVSNLFWMVVLWAFFEEIFKFIGAYWTGLKQKDDDEPVDKIIYLLTAALGFAALENTLFIFNPLFEGNLTLSFITGNLRFVGATLLHVICSASIGVALALSFYKNRVSKFLHFLTGLLTAVVLHTAFNLFIIKSEDDATFTVFYFVWLAIIVLLLCFERVKKVIGNKSEESSPNY